jgi:hypothetical protein
VRRLCAAEEMLSSDGGDSDSKKYKWGCDGDYGGGLLDFVFGGSLVSGGQLCAVCNKFYYFSAPE